MRKLFYHASSVLVVVGVVIAIWPLGQSTYGHWSQHELRNDWDAAAAKIPARMASANMPAPQPVIPAIGSAAASRGATTKHAYPSWPATRLIIPDLQIDAVVVQGIDSSSLSRGPGHYPNTALPGRPGNCVIAGHRNIYGSWFYNLDQLVPGATIDLITPAHDYTYRMLALTTISEADSSILKPPDQAGDARMTIITCTMPHSSDRVVVTAELVQTT